VCQLTASAIWCLCSLARLWLAAIRRGSVRAADRPRLWNWPIPRVCLVPDHGFDHPLLALVQRAAQFNGQQVAHPALASASYPGPLPWQLAVSGGIRVAIPQAASSSIGS
jgi:hypothetical protein